MGKPELYIQSHCINAEGPVWDDRTQTLYFIDVEAGRIFSYKDGQLTRWDVGEKIGCAVLRENGGMLAGLQSGIYEVDFPDGWKKLLTDPEADLPGNRFNDGKVDPRGRFLAGTLTMAAPPGEKGPMAALYRLDRKEKEWEAVKVVDKVGLANGLAWSADGKNLFFVDTDRGTVTRYDYDPETGAVGRGEVVIRVPAEMGHPDGMTIDEEGKLWIALWGGCAVTRWDPETGEMLERHEVPALCVSSCCFGGPDMDTLFITTASEQTDLEKYPLAGSVFRMKTSVRGAKSVRAAY